MKGPAAVWMDWTGEQETPCFLLRPKDRHDLVKMLREEPNLRDLRLRARGSGHSSSTVGAPRRDGFLVDFRDFALDAAGDWWHENLKTRQPGPIATGATTVRVAASTTIKDLNERLLKQSQAFLNLGSYDEQTIAGAVATATHGSGMISGPLCDFVVSLELVTVVQVAGQPVVKSFRIEPANGFTNRKRFEEAFALHGMELVQEDEVFYSAVVGLGCFGIVTALTLQVVPAFALEETRELMSWSELSPDVLTNSAADYYDFLVTSLPRPCEHQCLATWRTSSPPRTKDLTERDDARIEELEKLNRTRPEITDFLAGLGSAHPRIANKKAWKHGFKLEVERYPVPQRYVSSAAFRTSIGDFVYATSAEVAVPREEVVDAVDQIIEHAAAMDRQRLHHLSPYGVRFVRRSAHYLAPEYDRDTCTIEAPIIQGAHRRFGSRTTSEASINFMLERFQERFESRKYISRFHWGQRNFADYAYAVRAYPKFEKVWLQRMRDHNPFGIFDNAFTDSLGISFGMTPRG